MSPVQGHTGVEDQVQEVQVAEGGEELQQVSPEDGQGGVPHGVPAVFDVVANLSQVCGAVERVVQRTGRSGVGERRRRKRRWFGRQ